MHLVETFEGTYNNAYPDPAYGWAVPTICTGHTEGVQRGDYKTDAQCAALLGSDLQKFFDGVLRLVKVEADQAILDALTSFSFNVGLYALQTSTLLRLLNDRQYAAAANEFDKWVYAGGRVYLGLQRRRAAEKAMFLDGYADLSDIPKLTPAQARLIGFSEKASTANALTQAADKLKGQIERTKAVKARSPKTDREAYTERLRVLRREREQALKELDKIDD